jgi:uncharacterized protein YndB with AHSA1/START domain
MTTQHYGKAVVEFPNDLEVLLTREFEAPLQLVYDVFTKEEHVRKTIAPYGEEVTECSFDVRVGGEYRYTFVTDDGTDMTFHGVFLEVDPPTHLVETWFYDGWPDVEAVESIDFRESDGGTTVEWRLKFADQAGRDHMTKFDGIASNMDNIETYLRSLLDAGV